MSGKKRWRKVKKDIAREDKIFRKIEIIVRHYDYDRKDGLRIDKLLAKLNTTHLARQIKDDCAYYNFYHCIGCPPYLKKYCAEGYAPMDWDV